MKHSYFLLLLACLFLCAPVYGRRAGDGTSFAYDGAGNRMSRSIIIASPLASLDKGMSLDSTPELREAPESPAVYYSDALQETDIRIYPNPTLGQLAVEILHPKPEANYLITVHSAQGKLVFQKTSATGYTPIDLRHQARGLYLLRIVDGKDFLSWKIIKE